jgi:uncharacterized membrane protein SpoIIM required for sporulation
MVLESFIHPFRAIKKPWQMFLIGFVYATIAVFLSMWIFKQYSSLVMVFLTVLATVPFMYKTVKMEEKADMTLKDESSVMKEHARVLEYLIFLFVGILISYSVWFVALPAGTVQTLFSTQLETISAINSKVVGNAFSSSSIFAQIFFNNIKVLMFCLFFAFFYGVGAIFILTWNASVISAAVGDFVKNKIAEYVANIGSINLFNYFHVFSLGLLRYSIHGIPEIAAYFIGGLAGGIISVAMINHDLESNKFKNIITDALDLSLIAVFILFFAALIEVFITPIFF